MKLVKFGDGTFGVRRWRLFEGYTFKDMTSHNIYWWPLNSQFIINSHGTEEQARAALKRYTDRGKVVT